MLIVYVGLTGIYFKERMKKHKKSVVNRNNHSAYVEHLRDSEPHFDYYFEILHSESKSLPSTLLECLEIERFNSEGAILNDKADVNRLPLLHQNLHPKRRCPQIFFH